MRCQNSKKIIEESHKYLIKNFEYFPMVIKKINGSIITDVDGNEYIDFLASASSLNLGSRHPKIEKAIKEQMENFTQYIMGYILNDKCVEYAKLLTSVYPGGIKTKVAYCHSGSDANDCALKYVRA